ncbi:MAG: DHH family phosphoesterase [Chloroflexota bacterium]|jgi:single-stranded-DNA-specific exonuclease
MSLLFTEARIVMNSNVDATLWRAILERSSPDWPAPQAEMDEGRRFLTETTAKGRTVIAYHGDADGLSAALLVVRALRRLGQTDILPLPAGKGENVHSGTLPQRIHKATPDALIVLDIGSRPDPILPGLPTLVVDHHQPRGFPPDALVVSSYGREPIAPASLLTYLLVEPLVEMNDQVWLAALGSVADLGLSAPFQQVRAALKQYGRRNVTETVSLLNAAKRSSAHDVDSAFDILQRAREPADIAQGRIRGVERLRAYREEVNAEVARCSRTRPRFAGRVALLSFSSPAQVHPLVAIRWAHRLPGYIVIAANKGYLPGRVNFSLRSTGEIDLIRFLRGQDIGEVEGEFAHGHAQATGGSLAPEDFDRLLKAIGFED